MRKIVLLIFIFLFVGSGVAVSDIFCIGDNNHWQSDLYYKVSSQWIYIKNNIQVSCLPKNIDMGAYDDCTFHLVAVLDKNYSVPVGQSENVWYRTSIGDWDYESLCNTGDVIIKGVNQPAPCGALVKRFNIVEMLFFGNMIYSDGDYPVYEPDIKTFSFSCPFVPITEEPQ